MSKSPTKVMRRRSVKPRTDSERTKESFLTDLRTRTRVAIDILSHHISQRRLEHLLRLSQGYLSRLRAGVSNPSAELVANLAMLCQDPPTRLLELERFWALPAESWPPPAKPATRTALSPHGYYPRKPKGNTPKPLGPLIPNHSRSR
jgi:transcriptional regulator with XRE-family HTH domain